MNLKIILPVVLILIVGVVELVFADQTKYTLEIEKGWNLIPFGAFNKAGSETQSLFQYGYVYDLDDHKYILLWKNGDYTKSKYSDIQRGEEHWLIYSSNWYYSDKEGQMNLWFDNEGDVSKFDIRKGWNFVYIIPEMKGMSFSDFKGNCDIIKYCGWQFQKWQCVDWNSLTPEILESGTMADTDSDIGRGFVIKVSDDCTLGSSEGGGTSPPGLPGGNGGSSNGCLTNELFDPYKNKCVNKNLVCELDKDCLLLEGQTASFTGEDLIFTLISADEGQISLPDDDTATINVNGLGEVNLKSDYENSWVIFNDYTIVFESADGDENKIMGASFEVTKS